MDAWEPSWPGRPPGPGSLGKRIAALRADRGWTQQQMADRLGISRVAVSHLETDLNTPGERTVALLAGLFRVEPHDLVDGTSYPLAKADRLPSVVNRWTEVEHRLALLERDLWWLDRLDGDRLAGDRTTGDRTAGGPPRSDDALLAEWDATLAKLADGARDRDELDALRRARRRIADRHRP